MRIVDRHAKRRAWNVAQGLYDTVEKKPRRPTIFGLPWPAASRNENLVLELTDEMRINTIVDTSDAKHGKATERRRRCSDMVRKK